jgi:hypothetical protein
VQFSTITKVKCLFKDMKRKNSLDLFASLGLNLQLIFGFRANIVGRKRSEAWFSAQGTASYHNSCFHFLDLGLTEVKPLPLVPL